MNIKYMNLQELVDYSVQKIVEQGVRCRHEHADVCSYGDGNGNHCAVGYLVDTSNKLIMNYEGDVGELIAMMESEEIDILPVLESNIKVFSQVQQFHDAATKSIREYHRVLLTDIHNIDTTGDHFAAWIALGDEL